MGEESGRGLAGSSASGFLIGCNQGHGWDGVNLKTRLKQVTWFLTGCWTEGLGSSLVVGQRPRVVPCDVKPLQP